MDLAAPDLNHFDGLTGLHRASYEALTSTKGIGPAKAAELHALLGEVLVEAGVIAKPRAKPRAKSTKSAAKPATKSAAKS